MTVQEAIEIILKEGGGVSCPTSTGMGIWVETIEDIIDVAENIAANGEYVWEEVY